MALNTQKLLPGSTFSTVNTGAENVKKQVDPKLNIYKKVVKIDKLLKNSFLLQSKEQSKQRKESENQKREKREKDLEAPKKFKGFQILKNALPKTGFFDAIKRFILFTFAGWLFTNLFDFLPKLLGFVKIITPVISWFEKGIGALLEGIVSFIDLGYKAYDSVKSFAKTIGGEKFAQKFDALSGALNTMLNLAFIAAMSAGSLGGFGKGKGGKPGIGGGKPPGPAGKPRVTTSGGGTAGRPDLRNPLRQRPRVTGSGGGTAGRPDLRNPLRQRPTVTTGAGGKAGKGFGKLAGKGLGKFAGKLPFIGPLIDFGIRRLVFKEPLGKAAAGAVGAGAGQALGGFLGGSLGGIVGSVVPLAGTLLGAGAGSIIGSIIGGFIGDWIGVSLYDFIESKKNAKIKKMSSGGKVSTTNIKQKRKEKRLRLRGNRPSKIQIGKDIGGEKAIEKIYPNPERKFFGLTVPSFDGFSWTNLLFGTKTKTDDKNKNKKKKDDIKKVPNAVKTLLNVADALGTSGDWIGSLMRAGIQVALGEKPDAKSIAKTLSSVLRNVTDPAIKGIKSLSKEILGFAGGGEVSSMISSTDTLTLERSIEINLRGKFEDALGVVRMESKKRGIGKEEMIEENIKRGKTGEEVITGEDGGGIQVGPAGSSGDKLTMARNLMRDLGLTAAQAAGIVGNMAAESGVENARPQGSRPGTKAPLKVDGVTGYGLVQWTSKGRQQALADFAKSRRADLSKPLSMDIEYQFFLKEFKGAYGHVLKQLKNAKDVKAASTIFMQQYEVPAGYKTESKIMERYNMSKPIYEKLSKGEGKATEGKGTYIPEKYEGRDPRDPKSQKSKGDGKYAPSGSNVVSIGKSLVGKGFAVGEHPDFTKTTPKGSYTPGKGYVSNVHKGKGHYAGRAIDVTDWRGSLEDSKGRYRSVLDSLWANRKQHNIEMLIHDSWGYAGSWGKDPPGSHGHPTHMHIETKKQGGGLVSPTKPNVPMPNSFASYNDPRQSSTLAVQPVIIEKMMPIPMDNPIAFPGGGGSGVNNNVLSSLMQG